MNKQLLIHSIRDFEQYPSYLILYDFEDDFAASENLRIHNIQQQTYTFGKVIHKIFPSYNFPYPRRHHYTFCIMMTPDYYRMYPNKSNVIPYIIDYWKRYDDDFDNRFKHFPLVYISGLEVYEYLKSRNTKVNIRHLPLSISDRYLPLFYADTTKDIDIINIGRKNKTIDSYIQEYIKLYPDTNYVHREMENGENIYYSTRDGRIGKLETREDLLSMLCRSKIAIVTSPGLDGGEERTGGFNPVTPRVFEAAIGKCHMIGRYKKNVEFFEFGLDNLIDLPESFEAFKHSVNLKIETPFNRREEYEAFLQKNLNSCRFHKIMDDINAL